MIVYPAGYSAAEEAAGRPLMNPRIVYKNYVKERPYSSIVVSTDSADGPRDALTRPETNEWWIPTTYPATWECDLGADVSISAVGVAGHDLGTKASTIVVETQLNAGSWTTLGAASHAPTTDEPILLLDSPRTVDRVRMTLTGASVGKIASLFVGPTLTMQRPIQMGYQPITKARKAVRDSMISQGGHYLGQWFKRRGLSGPINFRFLTNSWYYANFDDFAKTAQNYPYFFAPQPADFLNDVVYAWHDRDIDPIYHAHIYIGVSWTMTAIQND